MAVSGNYVFVADGDGGLVILRLVGISQSPSFPVSPEPGSPQPTPSQFKVIRLTTNPANEIQPAWSPDGNTIVFPSDRIGGKTAMFAIILDGTDERLLAQFTVTNPWGGRFYGPSWLAGDLLLMDYKNFWEIMHFHLVRATSDNALPVGRNIEIVRTLRNSSLFLRDIIHFALLHQFLPFLKMAQR